MAEAANQSQVDDREVIRDAVRRWNELPAPNTINFLHRPYEDLAASLYKERFSIKGDALARRTCALLDMLGEGERAAKRRMDEIGMIWHRTGTDAEVDRMYADVRLLHLFADRIFKGKPPVDAALISAALARCAPIRFPDDLARRTGDLVIAYCERAPMPAEWREPAEKLYRALDAHDYGSKDRRRAHQLGELLGLKEVWPLDPSDAFAEQALADLRPTDGAERSAWIELMRHCQTVSNSPARKWLADADARIAAVGSTALVDRFGRWLRLIGAPGSVDRPIVYSEDRTDRTLLVQRNEDIACGMLWASSRVGDLASAIGHAAAAGYKKLYKGRVRSERIGAAAIRALGVMTDRRAVEELAKLEMIIRTPKARKVLTKTLEAAAEREGVTRDDLAESAAPDFGMIDGVVRVEFGDTAAELRVRGENAEVRWVDENGATRSSIPKGVKAEHPDAASDIKAMAKDLETAVVAQRRRIERLMRTERSWSVDRWRALYHDHPLVALIARRLIWTFDGVAAIWHDGAFRDASGSAIAIAGEVRLWHPIGQKVDDVIRWRDRLEHWQVTQPFKQAHREVYILTDAERNTRVYSNRFAAHIVKSAALAALCQTRGWVCGLYGGASSPRLDLPSFGLRAEYWVEAAGDEYTDFGTPKYLATDQVRFHENAAEDPLPLDRVPALALSEVMRDVDMFVGITSVGNDPQWSDGGPEGRYRDYWQTYSFGDLSGTAQTRKAVLERLVPKLKIADRSSFTDKFLVVRGDVRTYKIHLGSGNILMEPNDQYLCIVASAAMERGTDKLYLPFEGDRTLAIVLSKALLLADDAKIKDATILSQIGRR